MEECKKRLGCILVYSYSMVWYGLHTSPLVWYDVVCILAPCPGGQAVLWYQLHGMVSIY